MVPGKITTIRSLLHDSKYYPQDIIPITDTPRRYLMLKYHQMMKDKPHGLIHFQVLKEAFRVIAAKGGNPHKSELWILNQVHIELEAEYETLTNLKQYIRSSESAEVDIKLIAGNRWPIFLHSLHVPRARDHHNEIAWLTGRCRRPQNPNFQTLSPE